MTESLSRKTAVELASLIATRAVSPVEVLDAHLATIARVNPKLNAIVTLVADAARRSAKDAEAAVMRGDKLGALHGLPVVIKDIMPTAGIRIEQPKSVPCASGTMPVATATADPPEEPAGLNAGFQGLRVTPNTSLKVLAPAANSGVLVLPSTIAPAAFSRRTASASSVGTLSLNNGEP